MNLPDRGFAQEGDPPPARSQLLWNVVPFAEVPFFKHAFRRKPDITPGLAKLDADLHVLLKAEPSIRIFGQEVATTWFERGDTGSLDGPVWP
ncbi:hypothetical protein [Roseateles puraquae]|uniref:hypothetical protein n=1 Tax=Roseateles puraquae TaxID=431059 RepID=UPI001185FFA9|nr:hypothetical protein [Roseateles puraquae]MDG0855924.1 hypothetical protein [Roseateles puraquae]